MSTRATTTRGAALAACAGIFGMLGACRPSAAPGPFGVHASAVAGGRLYVLDEAGARVVRLAPTGRVTGAAPVGDRPQGLTATADGSWLLTLSPDHAQLSAVRASPDAPLSTRLVAVRQHMNTLAVSPSAAARYAVTWVDLAQEADVQVDGTASFNEITVVDLNGPVPSASSVVVGFNPREVVFTPDGTTAIVLSQSYASIVPLAAPASVVRVPLGADTAANPVTPETALATADGSAALVARAGSTDVFVISLAPPSVNIVDLGIVPTHFASSSDGATIVATSRGSASIALLDLASLQVQHATAGGPITDVVVPVDPTDRRMLLWGKGAGIEALYALDLDSASAATIALVNPPTEVSIGPDGTAVILHVRQPTPGGDEVQRFFDEHEALSLLDRRMRLLTPIALDALPASVAFYTGLDGHSHAIVPLTGSAHVAQVDLDEQLAASVNVAAVPDRALSLGAGASPVAIVHDQPFGLVTFLDPDGLTRHVAKDFLLDDKL